MSEETLTRAILDKLIPDRPAWIEDETGHNAWFNTKAMELAGITNDFKDTEESFFSRTESGEIAGVAFEGAMNPFLDALPRFQTEDLKIGFTKLIDEGNAKGITGFGDAYVFLITHIAQPVLKHYTGCIYSIGEAAWPKIRFSFKKAIASRSFSKNSVPLNNVSRLWLAGDGLMDSFAPTAIRTAIAN
jgi:hypothetical protein